MDFLTIVQKAQKEDILSQNIENAWRATSLMLYNPAIVLKKLESKRNLVAISTCPSTLTFTSTCPSGLTLERSQSNVLFSQTPANVDQIGQIDEFVFQFRNQTLDTSKLVLLSKLIKEAKQAIADHIILNTTNAELYKANVWKKKQAH